MWWLIEFLILMSVLVLLWYVYDMFTCIVWNQQNNAYAPCMINNNMCVYTNHFNHSLYYTVQVVNELKYTIVVVDIVVEIDYLLFFIAHIYHHVLIHCMYACSWNELNLLLYSSVMSPYPPTILVICTCIMWVMSVKSLINCTVLTYISYVSVHSATHTSHIFMRICMLQEGWQS